jgi:hypothetical protein
VIDPLRSTLESDPRTGYGLLFGSRARERARDNPYLGNPDLVESWKINGGYEILVYSFVDFAATYAVEDGLRLTLGVSNIFVQVTVSRHSHLNLDSSLRKLRRLQPEPRVAPAIHWSPVPDS